MKSLIDGAYLLPCAYAGIVTVIILLDRLRSWRNGGKQSDWPAIIAYLALTAAYLLISRERILRFDLAINPDEAQMAANAMRSRFGWLNWGMVDPVTSGPLNSAILAWPYLLGGDVTLYAARLAGLACVCGMAAFMLLAIRGLSDIRTAMMAVAPSVLLFGAIKWEDFVHYSSEHVPILLLALALYLFVRSFERDRIGFLLGSAFVLGLVPFAKLQGAPIAAVIGIFVLLRAAVTGPDRVASLRRGALVVVAALAPAAIYLVPLALSGGLDDMVKSYLIQPQFRGTSWANPIPAMVLRSGIVVGIVVSTALSLGGASMLLLMRRGAGTSFSPPLRWTGALACVLFPVTYAAISYTGRAFPHYLILAVPLLALIGGLALSTVARFPFPRRWQGGAMLTALYAASLAVMLPAAFREWPWGRFWVETADRAFLEGRMLEAPRSLAWLRPRADDSIVCWGWRPECYLDTAIRPATRDTTNENQHYAGSPLFGYFRARFMRDFDASSPAFVVDTAAPGSFTLNNPETDGVGSFPELAEVVARDFALASRVAPPGRCPRVHVRKDRLAALNRSLIALSSIEATAAVAGHEGAAVDDGSTFETCQDSWLLPERSRGAVTLRFREPAAVASFAILNARKRPDGRRGGTETIRLSILSGGAVVARRELTLRPYPFWTFHRLDRALEADSLVIDILSYRGVGGGLNEVKAYRD